MLQEDATYCLYNLSVAAHGHTHPVSTYVDHTPTFHIAPLAPATQLPQSHSAPHTQPLTHTHTHITRSQPRTPTVPAAPLPAMLRYESPSNAASGAHRPFPKELHAGTQLTLSQTRSRCRSPHRGAHTHTQAHEARYDGPHTCAPGAQTTSGKKPTESVPTRLASGLHPRLHSAAQHSEGPERLAPAGPLPSGGRSAYNAGQRSPRGDQRRQIRAAHIRLRTQSPSTSPSGCGLHFPEAPGEA